MKAPLIDPPRLVTRRLCLRPYDLTDAPELVRLVNDREVARHTLIPDPYTQEMAETWIGTHVHRFQQGVRVTCAVTRLLDSRLMGTVALGIEQPHDKADLHCWCGKEFWNQGYATEAAQRLIQYGFEAFGLHRIEASHSTKNPAAGRVLRKLGMRYDGRMRHALKRWGEYDDLELYAVLADDLPGAGGAARSG